MGHVFRASALVPRGFVVEETISDGTELLMAVRPTATSCVCPVVVPLPDGSIVGAAGLWPTCPSRADGFGCSLMFAGSTVARFSVADGSSPSDSKTTCWRRGRVAHHALSTSCIIWRLLWAVDRRRLSLGVSWCR